MSDKGYIYQYTNKSGETYSAWNVVIVGKRVAVITGFFPNQQTDKMQVRLMMLDTQLEVPNSGRCGYTTDADSIVRKASSLDVANLMVECLKAGVIGEEDEHLITQRHQTWYIHIAHRFDFLKRKIVQTYRGYSTIGRIDPLQHECKVRMKQLAHAGENSARQDFVPRIGTIIGDVNE